MSVFEHSSLLRNDTYFIHPDETCHGSVLLFRFDITRGGVIDRKLKIFKTIAKLN